jgi:hypothetical protein
VSRHSFIFMFFAAVAALLVLDPTLYVAVEALEHELPSPAADATEVDSPPGNSVIISCVSRAATYAAL